ncbi:MAG: hypothetical protein ACI9BW_003856, partial [Gammaproteobacteria bacterium]
MNSETDASDSDSNAEFGDKLHRVLASCLDNYDRLISYERLSGGANQETYRILFSDRTGAQNKLALRRAAGGSQTSQEAINVGLPTEALLFQIARDA